MKRLFIGCLVAMQALVSWADEVPVPLEGNNDIRENIDRDKRSLSIEPTVTHDGSTLYLYSEVVMEEVVVTVKDLATGETIASGVVTLLPGGATVLSLPAADEGTFQIDITVGDNSYWGIFTI